MGEHPWPSRIAIDGPSAAGKTVVGRALAQRLGYLYLDTGAMYRAITWLALKKSVDPGDEAGLTKLAEDSLVEIEKPNADDGRHYTVLVNGEDITWAVRKPDVEANVSAVSAIPGVRRALVSRQRQIGRNGKVVMVGRDIGTVVMPDAELKIFLVASPQERAMRRLQELVSRGQAADYDQILSAMVKRDRLDSEREVSPAIAAEDAVTVDTDGLSIEEVMAAVMALVEGR